MKGIILAGGTGSRLLPLTKVTNKHLLPIYDEPMIYYPLRTLVQTGIKEIMIVSSNDHAGHFLRLLGSGKDFGVKLRYALQEESLGIAHALGMTEEFAGGENVAVILGDNIFEDKFDISDFSRGARIFLKEVPDAHRFGVATVENGAVTEIIEKPKHPKSDFAVTGFYLYDSEVYKVIKTLRLSYRGEYELTDVSNYYVSQNRMGVQYVKGFWSDAGTFESLFRAATWVKSNSREKLNVMETGLRGVLIITPKVHEDERGHFFDSYDQQELRRYGIPSFVQHSQSFSRQGVVRGLHFQRPPYAQAKLVRVLKGTIWDVIVDIRTGSPTFGKYVATELSDSNLKQVYIPEGFAHGFSVLSESAIVSYNLHQPYNPNFESGIRYNDPEVAIDWKVNNPLISEKDKKLPWLKEIGGIFMY